MSKSEFLVELRKGLSGLPQNEIEERVVFYSEMIDDRIDEGLTEEEAVSEIGNVKEVISQILAEIPLSKLVKERVKPKHTLQAWVIVLLVLGSPVWLSLLVAALSVILAFYVVVWSVIVSLWSIEASLVGCSIGGLISATASSFRGNYVAAVGMFGFGILCAGLSIFLFFGCKKATKAILLLTKKIALGIKTMFIGKERTK